MGVFTFKRVVFLNTRKHDSGKTDRERQWNSGIWYLVSAVPGSDAMDKVSIIPRGINSLGYTSRCSTEDCFLMTVQELENNMAILLGRRAAERLGDLIFVRVTTGAAEDLVKVTEIARSMVTRYGMSQK